MVYAVKELFATLQGEGARTGQAAVFCRFAGCNLWRVQEEDRSNSAFRFCDTDFVGLDGPGRGRFAAAEILAHAIEAAWPGGQAERYVLLTGGEPLLQINAALVRVAHARGFEVAVEINGTLDPPPGVNWVTVSPKQKRPFWPRAGLCR